MKSSVPTRTPSRARRGGFTLIELIAVMGIILTMSLVVVSSYYSITRGIAERAGVRHIQEALLLTRQHACTDGKRTFLYFLDDQEYVLLRQLGTVNESGNPFVDYYSDLAPFARTNKVDVRVYDMSNTATRNYATVTKVEANMASGVQRGWKVHYTSDGGLNLKKDMPYGVELYAIRALPKGYAFKDLVGKYLFFEPDGSVSGNVPDNKITFVEEFASDIAQPQWVKIASDGKITTSKDK